MKHLKFSLIVLGGILLILGGCQRIDNPQPPELIAPEDGAEFDTLPITFIWSADALAEGYVIVVQADTLHPAYEIYQELADTTYAMGQGRFDSLSNTAYYWKAGSQWTDGDTKETVWSGYRFFVIDKPPEPGDPSPPELISPEDGAIFDTLPPIFVWGSDSLSKGYFVRIWTNSTTEVEDSLGDTTYAMSQEFFDGLAEGTYRWSAATVSASGKKFWSETWSFTITRPEPVTDLDTTYFPFGRGYEWCFERQEWGDGNFGNNWSYDTSYTYLVTVTDSFWRNDTMFFTLQTEKGEHIRGKGFWDVYDIAVIWNDQIKVWWKMIGLIPNPDPYLLRFWGDTLDVFSSFWDPAYSIHESIKRLKGIGVINQTYSYYFTTDIPPIEYERHDVRDTLLYFYNGEDTVWKAE